MSLPTSRAQVRATSLITGIAIALAVVPGRASAQYSPSEAEPAQDAGAADPQSRLPLRTRAALDAWLRQAAANGRRTPLDRMPPGARERFLASLDFGAGGLVGFDTFEVSSTLGPGDLHDVLGLFGPEVEAWADRLPDRRPPGIAALLGKPPSDLERRYTSLYLLGDRRDGGSDADRGQALAARFHDDFPEAAQDDLSSLGDFDLWFLFRAAGLATFYAPDAAATDALTRAGRALAARGRASPADLAETRDALLAMHRFADAQALTDAHPDAGLPPLPAFEDAMAADDPRPSVWRIEPQGNALRRLPVDLGPAQVLVLAGCHLSVDAANAIAVDPLLSGVFAKHARWLALPPGPQDIDEARHWNGEHPAAPMQLLYARADWPMFDRWEMPTFYVVREGKVLGRVVGWTPENRLRLIALMRRAGLPLALQEGGVGAAQGGASSSR